MIVEAGWLLLILLLRLASDPYQANAEVLENPMPAGSAWSGCCCPRQQLSHNNHFLLCPPLPQNLHVVESSHEFWCQFVMLAFGPHIADGACISQEQEGLARVRAHTGLLNNVIRSADEQSQDYKDTSPARALFTFQPVCDKTFQCFDGSLAVRNSVSGDDQRATQALVSCQL